MPCIQVTPENTAITLRADKEPVAPRNSHRVVGRSESVVARYIKWVEARCAVSSTWGWCQPVVIARLGDLVGEARLICCSYASEAQFRQSVDYHNLVEAALCDLQDKLVRLYSVIHVD